MCISNLFSEHYDRLAEVWNLLELFVHPCIILLQYFHTYYNIPIHHNLPCVGTFDLLICPSSPNFPAISLVRYQD